MTGANQWTIVEIEILATVSWTRGCQPFRCRCSQNVTHSRKEIYATSNLSKESIPAIPVGNSKHPTPTRSYCIMPIPSLQIENRIQSHAQKQRVWSLSCGLQDLLQCSDCALRCALWLLQTNDSFVEIEILATVSWTCGCQPFSCRCSQNVMHCRKEINATCLCKESFPAIYSFWEFQASLPARSVRFLRAAACSTGSALRLHHAQACVVTAEKTCLIQGSRGFGHGVVVFQELLQLTDCVFMWLL